MVTSLPPKSVEDGASPRTPITGDLPCVGCGYNLRTLPENGRCPECGEHVHVSLEVLTNPQRELWIDLRFATYVGMVGMALCLASAGGAAVSGSGSGICEAGILLGATLFVLSSITILASIGNVVPITYRWYKLIVIVAAVAFWTAQMGSLTEAALSMLFLGALFGLPTWSSSHILQVARKINAKSVGRTAWLNLWLGRVLFWISYGLIAAPDTSFSFLDFTLAVICAGAAMVGLLHVALLWMFALRLTPIARTVRGAERTGT